MTIQNTDPRHVKAFIQDHNDRAIVSDFFKRILFNSDGRYVTCDGEGDVVVTLTTTERDTLTPAYDYTSPFREPLVLSTQC